MHWSSLFLLCFQEYWLLLLHYILVGCEVMIVFSSDILYVVDEMFSLNDETKVCLSVEMSFSDLTNIIGVARNHSSCMKLDQCSTLCKVNHV